MAIQVNIAEAKARLSELVRRAEAGEEVILARDGKPVAVIGKAAEGPSLGKSFVGRWAHLGPLRDPYLFLRPEPEVEERADGPIEPAK